MGRIEDLYQIVRTCPICGKEFYPPTWEWAYIRKRRSTEPGHHAKVVIHYMCSWSCLREFDRRFPIKAGKYVDHGLRENVPRKKPPAEPLPRTELAKAETFAELLKMALKNANMSQKDLSLKSCGTRGTISNYCRGKTQPRDYARVVKICNALDIPIVIAERLLEQEEDDE